MDFGLRRQEQPLPFAFVQMTDPHGAHPLTLPQVLGECKGLPLAPSFYVCTGDMRSGSPTVRDLPDLERTFGGMARTFDQFGAPLFMVPGNHDTVEFDFRQTEPLTAERTAHPLFGNGCWECYVCPSYWSFSYGGVHFVALPYTGYVDGRWNSLPPQEERWLREDVQAAAGERIVFFTHNPSMGRLIEQYGMTLGLFGDSHTEGPYVRVGVEKPEFGPKALVGGMCQEARDPRTGERRYDATGRPMGYRIVVVSAGSIDTFFKALGEPHTIMATEPRRFAATRTGEGSALVGQFFDPAGSVTAVRVSVAGLPHEVTVTKGPLFGRFEAPLSHAGLPDGFHEVRVTAQYADGAYSVAEPYLLLAGVAGDFKATGPVHLTGRAERLAQPCPVLLNGQAAASVTGPAGGTFDVELPAVLLRRLNTVSIAASEGDRPLLRDVHLRSADGQVFYDQHRIFGWGFQSDLEPGKQLYFDLTCPGPPVRWNVEGPPSTEAGNQ